MKEPDLPRVRLFSCGNSGPGFSPRGKPDNLVIVGTDAVVASPRCARDNPWRAFGGRLCRRCPGGAGSGPPVDWRPSGSVSGVQFHPGPPAAIVAHAHERRRLVVIGYPHRRLIASLAAVTALAFGGSAAASQTQFGTFFTKFVFGPSSREAKGTIESSKSKCFKARKVKLIRQHNGNKKTLGADNTNSDGKFDIELSGKVKNGKYYAKATKKSFDNGKKTCLSATSGSVKIS
jgi:hypothetical protein